MATACSVVMANNAGVGSFGTASEFRSGQAATSCLLVAIAAVSICTLVVCGVLIVREYSLASTYEPTVCRLGNVSYTGSDVICRHCASGGSDKPAREKGPDACVQTQFPCVLILVMYPGPDGSGLRRALLYQDSVQASGAYSQCSFSVCNRKRDENERKVREFADRWRSRFGEPIGCYYDTTDEQRVIVEKNYTKNDVIHSMLWPSAVVFACGLIFLRLKIRRHHLTFCGRRSTSTDEIVDLVKKGTTVGAVGSADNRMATTTTAVRVRSMNGLVQVFEIAENEESGNDVIRAMEPLRKDKFADRRSRGAKKRIGDIGKCNSIAVGGAEFSNDVDDRSAAVLLSSSSSMPQLLMLLSSAAVKHDDDGREEALRRQSLSASALTPSASDVDVTKSPEAGLVMPSSMSSSSSSLLRAARGAGFQTSVVPMPIDYGESSNAQSDGLLRPSSPETSGPETSCPGTRGPETSGPGTSGPGTRGPETSGPGTRGSDTSGPGTSGPGTSRPETSGPGTSMPETSGPGTSGSALLVDSVNRRTLDGGLFSVRDGTDPC